MRAGIPEPCGAMTSPQGAGAGQLGQVSAMLGSCSLPIPQGLKGRSLVSSEPLACCFAGLHSSCQPFPAPSFFCMVQGGEFAQHNPTPAPQGPCASGALHGLQ